MASKFTQRISRITGKAIGTLSDMMAEPTVGMERARAAGFKKQAEDVQRKRVRRQLEAEYAHKEMNMPQPQSQTMAQTMENNRRRGVTSSGKGVGY